MEKGFLNSNFNQKKLYIGILIIGSAASIGMGVKEYDASKLLNEYELPRYEAGEGVYEQEMDVLIEGEEKFTLKVDVEERLLTKQEAEQVLREAIPILQECIKGENESLEKVSHHLNLVDKVPEMPVEVTWNPGASEYILSDGTLREDVEILEPVELEISAILECQGYYEDFETRIVLTPRSKTLQAELTGMIAQNDERDKHQKTLTLPKEYQGKTIVWRKHTSKDSISFFVLTIGAVVLLKLGSKNDERKKKKEYLAQLEAEYAQIVSKLMMMLSAGLSVRHAWERIVLMEQRKAGEKKAVYREMNWALCEMQKGMPELEVYERFGDRVGEVHYKKLMSAMLSYKKRGGTNLLDILHQEMLDAWEERKRKTRQQGELISTKLLLPMMGMLAIVFVMILVPAFLSFQ